MLKKNLIKTILVMLCMGFVAGSILKQDDFEQEVVDNKVVYYEKMVAITFDDGPSGTYTEMLLDGLKERGVKATFFLIGKNIENNEEIVRRMKEEGHLIGNHTYTHKELCSLDRNTIKMEIERTNSVIENITSEKVRYIRPPFGSFSEQVRWECKMTPIFWSVDTMDWGTTDVDKIVNETVKNTKSGDIILMHDTYYTSVVAALRIIDELQLQGYVFVTADELIIE